MELGSPRRRTTIVAADKGATVYAARCAALLYDSLAAELGRSHYQLTRDVLVAPDRYFRYLFDDPENGTPGAV
jgi:hypothetical protein